VQGCAATLVTPVSMRTPATGKPCGGELGPCSAPSDACAPGWQICLSDFSKPSLSADGFRSRMTATQCAGDDGGKYIAAMSHGNPSWAPPGGTCPATQSDNDNGCQGTGWGSEAICCGSGCVLAGCANDLWIGKTLIYDDQKHGCGSVFGVSDGFLCCKV
jgi:hypothetical protein